MLLNKVGQNHMAIQWFDTEQDTGGLKEIIKRRLIVSNRTGSLEMPSGKFRYSRPRYRYFLDSIRSIEL